MCVYGCFRKMLLHKNPPIPNGSREIVINLFERIVFGQPMVGLNYFCKKNILWDFWYTEIWKSVILFETISNVWETIYIRNHVCRLS